MKTDYYFSKRVHSDFNSAVDHVTEALKAEGFGIVTSMNLKEIFSKKLDVSFRNYVILGACNPNYAYKALQAEEKVGAMLPCNILAIDKEDGTVEIAAVNPVASMMAIENKELAGYAEEVTRKLQRVVNSL